MYWKTPWAKMLPRQPFGQLIMTLTKHMSGYWPMKLKKIQKASQKNTVAWVFWFMNQITSVGCTMRSTLKILSLPGCVLLRAI